MVTTRSKGEAGDHAAKSAGKPKTGQKRLRNLVSKPESAKPKKKQRKNQHESQQEEDEEKDGKVKSGKDQKKDTKSGNRKVEDLLNQYPNLPLSNTDLEEPGKATPD